GQSNVTSPKSRLKGVVFLVCAFCRATRTPACKEYDALKAKLGRGDGPWSSVGVSGELFVTKKFGQMKRLFFFGDFLFEPAKRKLPARRGGTRQLPPQGKK